MTCGRALLAGEANPATLTIYKAFCLDTAPDASLTGRVLTLPVHCDGKPGWLARPAELSLALRGTRIGDMIVVDQCVRLGMAIVIIALISLALYQFSNRAHARPVSPAVSAANVGH